MPWRDRSNAVCRRALLIGLAVATGCAHSQADLQERLSQRVALSEAGEARPSSKAAVTAGRQESKDATVQPAVALQPIERAQAPSETDRAAPLPPAIIPPPRRVDSGPVPPTAVSLPSDSDEAALDAITAAGKPLPLADAIQHAFRLQPRLRAQLENIAQARGQQQIAFSAFLPLVAANYDAGQYSLGVTGNSIRVPKQPPGI